MPVNVADTRAGVDAALTVLGDLAEVDVPLAPMTTYRVGGAADVFVKVRRIEDLEVVADALRISGLPLLVIGRGSNLLVNDAGFHGIAVSIAAVADTVSIGTPGEQEVPAPGGGSHGTDSVLVEAGSAVLLPVLARKTVTAGLTGFEWAVGVPGSVGGAVRMNAGGHGSDMSASLVDVVLVDLARQRPAPGTSEHAPADRPTADHPVAGGRTTDHADGRSGGGGNQEPTSLLRRVPAGELGLRFRGSDLPSTSVVVSARLRLTVGDPARGQRELSEIVAWRRANQPGGQNAGSVFVNPVPGEVSAGELVDRVGLRGHRLGTATVSDKHANFIQADEGGTARDVVELMAFVRRRVLDETGFALLSEIRLIGFEQPWD